MKFASDALFNQPNTLDFGAPAAAAALITSAALTTGVAAAFLAMGLSVADKWGRGLTVVASAASTRTFIIRGRDYLGQPMRFDGTLNGTTPVDIPKAFKFVDQANYGASADVVTVAINTSGKLGLPYKTVAVIASLENYLAATAGTLTAPDVTTPATATTTDPRGLWTPNGALNATRTIQFMGIYDFFQDALHGVQHFFA
jgi:hypothetical protein